MFTTDATLDVVGTVRSSQLTQSTAFLSSYFPRLRTEYFDAADEDPI